MRLAPNRPASPLSVCTARNTSLTSPGSTFPVRSPSSSASRSRPSPSTISCASERNSSRARSAPSIGPSVAEKRAPKGAKGTAFAGADQRNPFDAGVE
jgi:hypothetical protein